MATSEQSLSYYSDGLYIAETTLSQQRVAAIEKGAPVFQVTSTLSSIGQLPDRGVFVFEIVSSADKTQDRYVRVSRIADILEYPAQRETASLRGLKYYRTGSVRLSYLDVPSAAEAAKAISDTVDQLVQDWIVYTYEFAKGPPGDLFRLPSVANNTLSGLIDSWQKAQLGTLSAKAYYDSVKASLTTRQAERTAAQSKLDYSKQLQTLVTDNLLGQSVALSEIIRDLRIVSGYFGSFPGPAAFPVDATNLPSGGTAGTALWAGLNDFAYTTQATLETWAPTGGSPEEDIKNTLMAAYTTFKTDTIARIQGIQELTVGTTNGLVVGEAAYRDPTSDVTAIQSAVDNLVSALETIDSDIQVLTAQVLSAQRDYEASQAAAAAALTAVRNVYPSFDTTNPMAALA